MLPWPILGTDGSWPGQMVRGRDRWSGSGPTCLVHTDGSLHLTLSCFISFTSATVLKVSHPFWRCVSPFEKWITRSCICWQTHLNFPAFCSSNELTSPEGCRLYRGLATSKTQFSSGMFFNEQCRHSISPFHFLKKVNVNIGLQVIEGRCEGCKGTPYPSSPYS